MKKFKIEIIDNQILKFKEVTLFEFKKKNIFSKSRFHFVWSNRIGYNYRSRSVKNIEDIDKEIQEQFKIMLRDNSNDDFEVHEIIVKNHNQDGKTDN